MLIVTNAGTDKLQLITDAAVTVDVHADWIDRDTAAFTQTLGRTNTAISTATTTDIVATPGATTTRIVKTLHIRNKHATSSVGVTVQFDQNATLFELHKVTLLAGEMLEYVEGIGFFVAQTTRKAQFLRRVTADSIHATAATFADVTGLTCPVQSGKHYNFIAHLWHIGNATTTGAQFAINGPTMTAMRISGMDTILGSLTAATMGSPTTDVTTRDVAVIAETTGAATVVLAIMDGWINPSADGTFAVRATSEVTVAAGLTVKQGSFLNLWETDN